MRLLATLILFTCWLSAFTQPASVDLKARALGHLQVVYAAIQADPSLSYIDTEHFRQLIDAADEVDLNRAMANPSAEALLLTRQSQNGSVHQGAHRLNPEPTPPRIVRWVSLDSTDQLLPERVTSVDTIGTLVLTEPTRKRYDIYVSWCPGGRSKKEEVALFQERLFSQYQLLVKPSKGDYDIWFVAPPPPGSKFRKRVSGGKM